jgi:hypothetical protein
LNATWPILKQVSVLGIVCTLASCAQFDDSRTEIVMCPGSTIDVASPNLPISIQAVGRTSRRYQLADIDETFKLVPRHARWNGSFGMYRPPGMSRSRMALEESLLFFDSLEDMQYWMTWVQRQGGLFQFTSDGLVVHWGFRRPNAQASRAKRDLTVEVHQLLLKGVKPTNLPGASDEAFTIRNSDADCVTGDKRQSSFVASSSRVINGRRYSGWAVDIMREHDIQSEWVEIALKGHDPINNPNVSREPHVSGEYSTYMYGPKDGKEWLNGFSVTTDRSGAVVFMFR